MKTIGRSGFWLFYICVLRLQYAIHRRTHTQLDSESHSTCLYIVGIESETRERKRKRVSKRAWCSAHMCACCIVIVVLSMKVIVCSASEQLATPYCVRSTEIAIITNVKNCKQPQNSNGEKSANKQTNENMYNNDTSGQWVGTIEQERERERATHKKYDYRKRKKPPHRVFAVTRAHCLCMCVYFDIQTIKFRSVRHFSGNKHIRITQITHELFLRAHEEFDEKHSNKKPPSSSPSVGFLFQVVFFFAVRCGVHYYLFHSFWHFWFHWITTSLKVVCACGERVCGSARLFLCASFRCRCRRWTHERKKNDSYSYRRNIVLIPANLVSVWDKNWAGLSRCFLHCVVAVCVWFMWLVGVFFL